ncbi:hypothetical protein M9Y10_029588 [Tritrichomonas musculus]|uniref:SANT domain-containing protein n=1 Tax=Tritrichomonas musculus TaxID=1915356 RepID=A0ABR2KN72_9EUKA
MRQIPPPILVSNDLAQQNAQNNRNQAQRTVSQPPTGPSPFLTIESPSSQQSSHIPSITSYSSNVRTTIQNIGPSPSGTIRSPIVRVIKPHQVPGRPLSAYPFSSLAPKKQNAAPYPTLPSKLEISEQRNKVEQEIQCLRAELSSLMHQWNFYNEELLSYSMEHNSDINSKSSTNSSITQDSENDQNINEKNTLNDEANNSSSEIKTKSKTKHSMVLPTDITKSSIIHGVKEYHNILLSDPLIESVINSNREKKKESESSAFAQKLSPEATFRAINDLPLYKTTIQDIKEMVAPVFAAHFKSRELIKQKQEYLTKCYLEIHEESKHLRDKVDDYNIRVDSVSENWPSDFPKGKTKTENEEELAKWTAPDQPMLMTQTRLITNCYYNTNGYVPNPVEAHEEYKNRISWSDDEKKKFVSKYMQHPKKFRLIADSLPLKSVKDVIEFYYVNRYTLSLKEKETARRKRGGKKKVISEGSAKTTK